VGHWIYQFINLADLGVPICELDFFSSSSHSSEALSPTMSSMTVPCQIPVPCSWVAFLDVSATSHSVSLTVAPQPPFWSYLFCPQLRGGCETIPQDLTFVVKERKKGGKERSKGEKG
jgi:hypothetical protein